MNSRIKLYPHLGDEMDEDLTLDQLQVRARDGVDWVGDGLENRRLDKSVENIHRRTKSV